MELVGPVFVAVMCGAIVGAGMQLGMGMALLSTESIDSPRFLVRWAYRTCLFCMTLFVSFLVSPIILVSIFPSLMPAAKASGFAGLWYLGICLPLAIALLWLDLKFVRSCDARMLAGRNAFIRKFGRKRQ
ncbi:MAG: hypothetical protein O9256_04420 [Rhizobiaceae bacterium]|nr:hypothetical protein [Rhizobiaceae bacterium]